MTQNEERLNLMRVFKINPDKKVIQMNQVVRIEIWNSKALIVSKNDKLTEKIVIN